MWADSVDTVFKRSKGICLFQKSQVAAEKETIPGEFANQDRRPTGKYWKNGMY